jgi:hypothetical protein
MNFAAIASAGTTPPRSPSVEKALLELAQMPVTEACVSGSCDFCLYQADQCTIVGSRRGNSHPSGRSGK